MQPLAILALLGSASAASTSLLGRQTPDGACAKGVHTIAIGGGNSPDEYSLGLLVTLATNITAAIPGSDYVSLPYNKVQPEPNMLTPGAIPAAVTLLGQYVSEYHAACPDSKIAIIGYSSGAVISSLAICESFTVPQDLAGNTIIAHIEYGAETYNLGQSYDRGTCVSGEGNQPLTDPAACGAFIPLTQSYCDENDPQCCDGPPADYQIHFVYPPKYDLDATNFVVSQFKKLGGSVASKPKPKPKPTTSIVPTTTRSPPTQLPSTTQPDPVTPTSTVTLPISTMPSISAAPPLAPGNMTTSAPIGTITPPPPPASAAVYFKSANLLNAIGMGALVFLGATLF